MASVNKIVEYWSAHQDESHLSVGWDEATTRCWRCGYKSKLDKCHIIPDSCGGSNEPSNLVLLCNLCHREAPNIADPRFMWIWLRAHRAFFYDTYWSQRGAEEFRKMFGRNPFKCVDLNHVDENQVQNLLKDEIQKAIVHFGEGRMNPSTIACIIYSIEEQLTKRI
ncbi:MAG: HNH endonuclease [Blastopirellula sp.]|nr:MAG: HNH endonuclease [Blastopirellula sp.]